jgi:hypothetical protein
VEIPILFFGAILFLTFDFHLKRTTFHLNFSFSQIEHILLSSNRLEAVDVISLSSTCRRLRNFFYRSAAIWKTLFSTNFAEISRSVEKKIERLADEDHDLHILWQKLFMQRFVAGKLVRREVERMSKKFFHRQDLSNEDMEHFVDLVPLFDGSDNFDEMEDEQKLKVLANNNCIHFETT